MLGFFVRGNEIEMAETDAASSSNNQALQGTNDSATDAKACAVKLGYYDDPYIKYFSRVRSGERKEPEINRGNFIRVRLVKDILEQFISKCKVKNLKCQIINLGCGFDTLFWRLSDSCPDFGDYFEMDLAEVTAKKAFVVHRVPTLKVKAAGEESGVLNVANQGTDLHGLNYHLIAGDLRKLPELEEKLIKDCGFNFEAPTAVLTECVLVYLQPTVAKELLQLFTSKAKTVAFINYEQVNMNSRFAQIMMDNFRQHNCELLGRESCASLETQMRRLLDAGCGGANAVNIWDAYQGLPHSLKVRIEAIEFLDEVEILKQLLEHYCVAWGWQDAHDLDLAGLLL